MEEKILAQGKKSNSSIKALSIICTIELGFMVAILICALVFKLPVLLVPAGLFLLLGFILFLIYLASKKVSIIVTENKVCGTYGLMIPTYFELPMDSINSIETYVKGFAIRTSSRVISFGDIDNAAEITKAISDLIANRRTASTINLSTTQSNADELKKYKDLLDQGIITQEEFDAKKKQLLGL